MFPAKPHRGLRRAYLDRVLLPALRRSKPDAVLVVDPRKPLRDLAGLAAHKAPPIRALLDRSGFGCRCRPAWLPDLDPIKPAWAKAKATLRRVAAPTAEALHVALGPALAGVTAQDAAGFFRHRGYAPPS